MYEKYNLDGETYRALNEPLASIRGQRLALQDYEGVYRLDSGNYLEAHEWIAQEWDGEGIEPLGWVYYTIYPTLSDDAIDIDGGVMGYDLHTTLEDFSEFLGSATQGRITRKIGVIA